MNAIFAVGAASVAKRLLSGRRALVSFAFIRAGRWVRLSDAVALSSVCRGVWCDSGAFTAWTQGAPIPLDEYTDFLDRNHSLFERVVALDVIGDGRASHDNWARMMSADRAWRDKLIPVFHEGDDVSLLDHYMEGSSTVGLGRTFGRKSKAATFAFYDLAFNRYPLGRFHAFGNGSPETLEPYPFESFDCTTWERDATYGGSHGWPWSAASKEARMRAYVEAFETIRYRGGPARQMDIDELTARPTPTETMDEL